MESVAAPEADATRPRRPVVSIVVPVYNGGPEIARNVEIIRAAVAEPLGAAAVEIVVVSDGSVDDTVEHLAEASTDALRLIHYDRNLGKGFAIKTGALAAQGEWIAFIDADLDLDPASIVTFLDVARGEGLDFAIGSKRHPESVVHYPRARRVASWGYQQLNRVLFRLDVRDTQVGLKVFHRRIAERVIPLLLVKQFAFDLELLAVSRALGYGRIRELPVRLDYRFTGSGVRSAAVARALVDTAAIFYRLRVLRTYQRKARLLGPTSTVVFQPPVTLVAGDDRAASLLDYPCLDRAAAVSEATSDVLALLVPGASPSGSWIASCVPYLVRPEVAAVVSPTLAPLHGSLRERVSAATLESRLGGGSRRVRYVPGNVREVRDYPASSIVIRRSDLATATAAGADAESLVSTLAASGRAVVYTPDTMVVESPPPALLPLVAASLRHGRARGCAARRSAGRSLSASTAVALSPLLGAVVGLLLVAAGSSTRGVGVAVLAAVAVLLAGSAVAAAVRFHALSVGALVPFAVVSTEAAYAVGFLRGVVARG